MLKFSVERPVYNYSFTVSIISLPPLPPSVSCFLRTWAVALR